jgi:HlyD family secretion protein
VEQSDPTGTLRKQLEIAQERLNQAIIRAPGDGVVLKVFMRAGEFIAQKPILQMAQLDSMVCVAEVFDGDVKHVSVGQKVQMRTRAFAGDFRKTYVTGTVQRIGNMVKTPELQQLDPYAPVDRRVIEVRIELDDVSEAARLVNEEATALVNLQVEVTFLVDGAGGAGADKALEP